MVRKRILTGILALELIAVAPYETSAAVCKAGPGEKIRNYGIVYQREWTAVREEAKDTARIVGSLPDSGLCYIQDTENGWCRIISGEVEGYLREEELCRDEEAWMLVHAIGENNFTLGESLQEGDQADQGLYQALVASAPAEGLGGEILRQEIVDFACQFVGNPYVWGGTSLTNGADCSGFVQTVFAQYGITLPRVSAQQALEGKKIPVSEAQPGDLIFYSKNGSVYHVILCIGEGKAVQACDSKTGIIVSDIPEKNACWAVSLIE